MTKPARQLPLVPDAWSNLPSPKIRRVDREQPPYVWSKFYSAFSERFALAALEVLGPTEGGVILDPFCGTGTTLVAAAKLGYPAIGVDLDPFSALLARCSFAVKAEPVHVDRILDAPSEAQRSTDSAKDLFSPEDFGYANAILQRTLSMSAAKLSWDLLLEKRGMSYDSHAVALCALGLAASGVANLAQGSNPVWYRRVSEKERKLSISMRSLTQRIAHRLLQDLQVLRQQYNTADLAVLNSDMIFARTSGRPVDIILSSPPYLNRLDYVVNHFAPLALLSPVLGIELDTLRGQMLGTTKIVQKSGSPKPSWGATALATLERIRAHSSKASESYYYWIYFDYFQKLQERLRRLTELSHSHTRILLVLQNSFYKEVEVALDKIAVEMAREFGLLGITVRSERVRAHLGTLSPKQTSYVPSKVLREEVIFLQGC